MTHTAPPRSRASYDENAPSGWIGWVVFAGVMMMMVGGFHALAGFVALFKDEYYVTRPNGLVINVDYTAWGWTHLILGAVVFAAGCAVLAGQMWARIVGVALAVASAFANALFVAAYPWWSLIVITLDVLVIWALVVHGREARR